MPNIEKPHARHSIKDLGRRTARRVGLVFLSLALFVTSAAGFAYMDLQGQITRINIDRYLDGSVTRTDAIGDSYDGHALNILVLGTDTRSGANNVDGSDGSDDTAVARSDTAMIMHVSADRSRVEVVSIPRDLLVDIPKCKTYDDTESAPQSDTMFNNAFATGAGTGTDATALAIGAACSINTVEKMTGVNIDEFMVVDFHGLETMVDALGGVNLYVSEEIDDPDYTQLHLSVGCQHLNGTDGLKYARARHGYGNGSDIGRIQHQQNLMGAMIRTAQSKNILSNANELYSFARTALGALTTSEKIGDLNNLQGLASSIQSIGMDHITFLTVPNAPAESDANRVVATDDAKPIWKALKNDTAVPTNSVSGKADGSTASPAPDSTGAAATDPSSTDAAEKTQAPAAKPSDAPASQAPASETPSNDPAAQCK
ncbi:LCP family protein [Actinomyces timonensis]|uniref:LCP family protein n=1 Tax=Actinomyces timonensis TaxID=1288391 RepID=UPI000475001F|nr:LCP family protein [Actinomyces timonensis]